MTASRGYVDPEYLRAVGDFLNQLKQRTYVAMKLKIGHTVLDVGCGPGTDTIPLAQWVGSQGRVIGVDFDPAMIAEAEQNAEKAGVNGWVKHQLANASALNFESAQFDSCRSERLFQHLSHPEQALSEMSRVAKPDGWVVVLDTDWGTLSIDSAEVDIERRLARYHADQMQQNGYAGRQLYRLFKQQGLADVVFEVFPMAVTSDAVSRQILGADQMEQEAVTAGVLTTDELQRWRTGLEQADQAGTYFSSGCLIMVAGRKI